MEEIDITDLLFPVEPMDLEKVVKIEWRGDHFEKLKAHTIDGDENHMYGIFNRNGKKYQSIRQIFNLERTLERQGYYIRYDSKTESELLRYKIESGLL
jgi:hypothetical protein